MTRGMEVASRRVRSAALLLIAALAAFTWSRGEPQWWMYGPVSLVIAALASVVADSGGARPHIHGPHRMQPSR